LYKVPVIPFWLIRGVEKLVLVDTCTWYDAAPGDAFQLNVSVVD
jgi:hypothetical protein